MTAFRCPTTLVHSRNTKRSKVRRELFEKEKKSSTPLKAMLGFNSLMRWETISTSLTNMSCSLKHSLRARRLTITKECK